MTQKEETSFHKGRETTRVGSPLTSNTTNAIGGVPQGSMLGSALFTSEMSENAAASPHFYCTQSHLDHGHKSVVIQEFKWLIFCFHPTSTNNINAGVPTALRSEMDFKLHVCI